MKLQAGVPPAELVDSHPSETSRLYAEGMVAGVIGAVTVAVWFLVLDTIQGRPLHTPTVLGTAFFRQGAGLAGPGDLAVSLELTLVYTWVHGLVFCVVGGIAARLIAAAERNPDLGFGIVLLGVVFEIGFLVVVMLFAETVLHRLAWQSILVGNFLAAVTMGAYFYRRHPRLTIRP